MAGKLAEGRAVKGGVADDSLGRTKRGGVADDSLGVGDLAAGRTKRGGVADDSLGVGDAAAGRAKRGGVADDSLGVGDAAAGRTKRGGVADDSIGVAESAAGRTALIGKKVPGGIRKGVPDDSIGRTRRTGVPDDSIGDQVRSSLVGPETDKAHLALQQSVYERMETPSYLFNADTGHAKPLGNNAKAVGDALGPKVATSLLKLSDQDRTVAARMDDIIQGTVHSPAGTREALLRALAADPKGNTGLIASHIANSKEFTSLPGPLQASVANTMSHLDEKGMRLMGALLEQVPQSLKHVDSQGGTFAANLEKIASQPLNSMLAGKTTSTEVINAVLLDVVNPNRIDQGTAPTCTVTSMQFELAVESPSEYARLMAGLTGPEGTAKMKGGGDLALGAEDADPKAIDGRSISQALFQSAAMEYANGKDTYFDPIAGTSTNRVNGDTYGGLKPAQQTQILRGLFGTTYRTDTFYTEADGAKALAELKGFDSAANVNRPIILDIDQGPINHAVTLESVANGKVTFRDPYGALRSIPEALFPKYVVAMHRPSDMFPN